MVCPPATSEAGILSAKVVSCSNINGYLRNYQDCLTLGNRFFHFLTFGYISKGWYRCQYFRWRQNSTDLNFPHFFRQLSLKMFGRQQCCLTPSKILAWSGLTSCLGTSWPKSSRTLTRLLFLDTRVDSENLIKQISFGRSAYQLFSKCDLNS
jgi:hypothetical protein